MFAIKIICRASEGFKTKVFKNTYRNTWSKNYNFIVKKSAQCQFWKCKFWIFGCQIMLKKNMTIFYSIFLLLKKTTFVFSLENIPYFTFLQNMIVLSLCWFLTSWALHIISIANITKQLRILYQNSKFVLNFATTMPQIVNITQICCLLTKLGVLLALTQASLIQFK